MASLRSVFPLSCFLLLRAATFGQTQGAASPGDSESPPIELATLEITAHPSGADERSAAVWVQRAGVNETPTRLADMLGFVPGLNLDQAGGAGGRSTLYLRGGEENHTLVLLDGVPLNDPTNSRGGGVDFSLIDPAALDSAAVVRGPGSMRYGPDAISGVIHLSTATSSTPGTRGFAEAGGDGLGRAALRSTISLGRNSSFTGGATWHEEEAAHDAGDMRRTFLHAAYQYRSTIDFDVHAWRLEQDSTSFPDDSGGVRLAALRDLEQRSDRQTAVTLHFGQHGDDSSWSVNADAARLDAFTTSPGVAPGVRDPAGLPGSVDDIRLDRLRAAAMLERKIGRWNVSAGADMAREDGTDDAMLDFGVFQLPAGFDAVRERAGAFVEGVGAVSDHITVAAGVRGDHFNDVGTHATGRFGMIGRITDVWQWRTNVGTGFKAPSFYGLAHPLVGNPDLKPERGRSLDAGLRHTFASGRGFLDISAFATELRNGVDFDPGPPPRIANRAEIRSRGLEAGAAWEVTPALRVSGMLSYTDTRSEPDGARMRSRPRWIGAAGLDWTPAAAWTFGVRAIGVDRVPDSSIPTGDVVLPGWVRADLHARWSIHEHWVAMAACDNVFDHEYEQVVGFTAPGRRLRLGVQLAF